MIPLHSAWLLLTTYRACAWDNRGYGEGLNPCGGPDAIEGAGWARMGIVVFGGLGLLLIIAVDVLFPAVVGRRQRQWATAVLAVPLPYLLAAAAFTLVH
ncbi:hypothetical protein [Streptomyces sp. NBC_00102]|uniref:hypothetical protein n=1 Tax=Streptomyces sp. NBC_00102 TaxID=2975652 RepID=UPI0022512FE4|nr:hypothetical protein [Streptomyces sp. NBC_00102]MCX5397089.1 hypothetical protein [Streptomyces sp. NBC_00102]